MEKPIVPEGKKIVLFDGVCNLCDSAVQMIIKNDKKDVGKKYETRYPRSQFKKNNIIDYELYYEGLDRFNSLCKQYLS
jgi:hypothetical protein